MRMTSVAKLLALPVLALALGGQGHAGTIVQTIQVAQVAPDLTPFDINGLLFDPGNGILVDVKVEMRGTLKPVVEHSELAPGTTATLTTHLFVSVVSPGQSVIVDVQTGVGLVGNKLTGAATPVDETFHFSVPTELAAFEPPKAPHDSLARFGFLTGTDIPCGICSNFTIFAGDAIVTYTFIPEPATALSFAFMLLGLEWKRRCRRIRG